MKMDLLQSNKSDKTEKTGDGNTSPVFRRLENTVNSSTTDEKTGKKKRTSYKQQVQELQTELELVKQNNISAVVTDDAVAMVTGGLLQVLEGITTLKYTEVEPKTKEAFDKSSTVAMNYYLKDKLSAEATPLMMVGFSFAIMTLEAYKKKPKKQKVTNDKPMKVKKDTPDKDVSELPSNSQHQPLIV